MQFVACSNCHLNKFRVSTEEINEEVVVGQFGPVIKKTMRTLQVFSIECDNCKTVLVKLAQAKV
jgi:hypothetical protein